MPPERTLKKNHAVRCWLHEDVPPGQDRKIHADAEAEATGAGSPTASGADSAPERRATGSGESGEIPQGGEQ
jgi:hypothetical protein